MEPRSYTSFEQIDKELHILQLRRQIAREQIKGDIGDIKRQFEPSHLFSSFGAGLLKKVLLSWLMGFILRRVKR